MADDPAILNDCQGLSAKWKWTYRHEDRLRNLLYTGFQSDLVLHLRPAGTKVPVHKIFLQAGSPVLNSRIMSNGTKEELIIENVDTRVFQKFLMFLYTGKSNAKIGSALPLLQLATEYEVNGLRDYCVNILKGTLTLENVLSLFSSGMEYAHGDFIQYTLNFICENASKVLQSEKFTQLRLDCLIEIIQEDSLQVKDEMEVFDAVNRLGLI
ncbi:kelch-like protein 20 [Folsomia candida]|uniref:kelch-like protein 20 n=1 Tax=Folsomia candida TaxID=158441 RepID=UPI001605572C|nr:kelch-like protein 20 [Folsomia candida]